MAFLMAYFNHGNVAYIQRMKLAKGSLMTR